MKQSKALTLKTRRVLELVGRGTYKQEGEGFFRASVTGEKLDASILNQLRKQGFIHRVGLGYAFSELLLTDVGEVLFREMNTCN